MLHYKTRHFIWDVIYSFSVDHPIAKFYENDPKFKIFKEECSVTGTTEESIANAEKIGYKTDLLAVNPLDKNSKYQFILQTLF